MPRFGMVIDTKKCVGCMDCVVACQTENDVPTGFCKDWIVRCLVSFIDFGPTVLRLAGVDVPSQVDGRAFLGKGVSMKEVDARDELVVVGVVQFSRQLKRDRVGVG